MRVAIIGSRGQLGTDLVKVLDEAGAYQVFPLDHGRVYSTVFVRVDKCEDRLGGFLSNPARAFHVERVSVIPDYHENSDVPFHLHFSHWCSDQLSDFQAAFIIP